MADTITYGQIPFFIGIPYWTPSSGGIQYRAQGMPIAKDLDTGLDDAGFWAAVYAAQIPNDPSWWVLADGNNPVTAPLTTTRTVQSCHGPVLVKTTLTIPPNVGNTWYGNNAFQKLGFIRRLTSGAAEQPLWINAANQSTPLGFVRGDAVEIVLRPGITGSALIYPWVGVPPLQVNYFNQGWVEFPNSWPYNGPVPVPM